MKRILIVDDEPSITTVIGRVIKSIGFQYDSASTGEAAIEKVRENSYDLILMDEKMPGMSGIQTLGSLKNANSSCDTPVVMMTAFSAWNTVEHAIRSGASDFIVKPFSIELLVKKIRRWVNQRAMENWKALPQLHQKALDTTFCAFEAMFDIDNFDNDKLPYPLLADAAVSLYHLVERDEVADLLRALEQIQDQEFVHAVQTGTYLGIIVREFYRASRDEVVNIIAGGMLHDVGKVRLPLGLITKAGPLDAAEYADIKLHVDHTLTIVEKLESASPVIEEICRFHHERMDGTGYPLGVGAARIPFLARASAIADVYSALTIDWPFQQRVNGEQAFARMSEIATGFDPKLFALSKELFLDYRFHTA